MKPLPRRHVLRGMGAAIALPLLDAMVPAWGQGPKPPRRLMIVYAPSGMIMPYWTPERAGSSFDLPRTLKPLESHRDGCTSLTWVRFWRKTSPAAL